MPDAHAADLASLAARLEVLEGRNGRLEARTAALEAENAALREARAASPPAPGTRPDPPDRPDPSGPADAPAPVGRRHLLTRGAAAAGVALAGSQPAAAVDGGSILAGRTTTSVGTTVLEHSGGSNALLVQSPNGFGLTIESPRPLVLQGRSYHLLMAYRSDIVPPPDTTAFHERGEMLVDQFGNLWFCTATGQPGTWRSISGQGTAGAFFPWTTPIRVYDSRPGTVPATGPKTKLNGTRVLDMRANGGANHLGRAVLVNVLLVNATAGSGNFTIWANGQPKPQANTMVWGGSAGRFSTLAFTTLDSSGRIQVNASLATDVVIDVIGQYG